MPKKTLTFSGFLIVVDDKAIDEGHFKAKIDETVKLNKVADKEYYYHPTYADSVLYIYVTYGSPTPRPDTVVEIGTGNEKPNTRGMDEFEPKQSFIMLDFTNSYLWLSNSRQRNQTLEVLKTLLGTLNVVVKEIYTPDEFIKAIDSIDGLRMSAVPNIFENSNTTSEALTQDMYGYGGSEATLEFKYDRNQKLVDKVKGKLESLLGHKESFKNIMISGRDANGVGLLFNTSYFSKKVDIECIVPDSHQYNKDEVFEKLIKKVRDEIK